MTSNEKYSPCMIYIDKEGHWFHKGVEMIHRDFIHLFYSNMTLKPDGKYIITWNDQKCYVEVEDTAFVVRKVIFRQGDKKASSSFELFLSDDSNEDLQPETIFMGDKNVLYCKVKKGTFPARFDRAAYYQLAENILEEDDQYYLLVNGKKHLIC